MSVINAMEFIELVKSNDGFRQKCYEYLNVEDLMEMLMQNNKGFTPDDFENAINMNLIKCRLFLMENICIIIQRIFLHILIILCNII